MDNLQVLRNPEDVKVPGRITEDLGQGELPKKSRSQQGLQRETVCCIPLPHSFPSWIKADPCCQPEETKYAHSKKRCSPPGAQQDPCKQGWSENRSDGRAAVENTRSERSLFRGKPFRDQLHPGRIVARLPYAEQESEDAQAEGSGGECAQHFCCRPPGNGAGIAGPGSQAVQQPAGDAI